MEKIQNSLPILVAGDLLLFLYVMINLLRAAWIELQACQSILQEKRTSKKE